MVLRSVINKQTNHQLIVLIVALITTSLSHASYHDKFTKQLSKFFNVHKKQKKSYCPPPNPDETDKNIFCTTATKVFNVLVVGDPGTGKTTLIKRFCEQNSRKNDNFLEITDHYFTNHLTKTDENQSEDVRFCLTEYHGWDNYRCGGRPWFRGNQAIIIVFDITNPLTFTNCHSWLHEFQRYNNHFILVGNKCDTLDLATRTSNALMNLHKHKNSYFKMLPKDIIILLEILIFHLSGDFVSSESIDNFVTEHHVPFLKISAKEDLSVNDLFAMAYLTYDDESRDLY